MSKFKTLPFWNAVSIAALTVVTAILYFYSAFLLSLWLLKRNKIRMGGTTARRVKLNERLTANVPGANQAVEGECQ